LRNMRALAKRLLLRVPGIRPLATHTIACMKSLATRVPGARHALWRRLLADRMNGTESLVSAAQNVAHVIDNYLVREAPVPAHLMVSMEVLLKEIVHRRIPLSPPLMWALQVYGVVKTGVQKSYLISRECPSDNREERARIDGLAAGLGIVECVKTRRSVRRWTGKEVSIEEVRKLVEIAEWAPSSCNLQPWKVLLLTAPEDKSFMTQFYGAAHNQFWSLAPLLLVILINLEAYPARQTTYVYLDGGAFIQNLLLLFHAHGLGACWIGFLAWDNFGGCGIEGSKRDEFYSRFGVSPDYLPISLIPVGYPAVVPNPPARKPVEEIIL